MYTTVSKRAGLCKASTHKFQDILSHSSAEVSNPRARRGWADDQSSQTSSVVTARKVTREDDSSVCGSTAKHSSAKHSSLSTVTKSTERQESAKHSSLSTVTKSTEKQESAKHSSLSTVTKSTEKQEFYITVEIWSAIQDALLKSESKSTEQQESYMTEENLRALQDALKSKSTQANTKFQCLAMPLSSEDGMVGKYSVQKAHRATPENSAAVYDDRRTGFSGESPLSATLPHRIVNRKSGSTRVVQSLRCKPPSSLNGISEAEIHDDMERVVRKYAGRS